MNNSNENTTDPAVNTNNTDATNKADDEQKAAHKEIYDWENKVKSTKSHMGIVLSITIIILGLTSASFVLNWSMWISLFLIVICLMLIFITIGAVIEYYVANSNLSSANIKLKIYNSWPDEQKKGYYHSLLNMNVENLSLYYQIVRVHASESFMASLVLSIIGIIIITGGIVAGIYTGAGKAYIAYISTASGIIMEIISGLLFYLYDKTVRQLKDYHDSLINSQHVFLSFMLINSVTDQKQKFDLIVKLIESLNLRQTNAVQ